MAWTIRPARSPAPFAIAARHAGRRHSRLLLATENADLFRHVVGGYGLFGVMLHGDARHHRKRRLPDLARRSSAPTTFPAFFATEIEPDKGLGLFYGHLSTAPGNFLEDMIVYRYDEVAGEAPADLPPLDEPSGVALKRVIMNLAKYGGLFQTLKWFSEKNLEPEFEACTVPRTVAMGEGEACLVTRNNPMHDSVPYLFNDLADQTDILHEYFIPRRAYNAFIAEARRVLANQPLPVLNASIRVVHQEDIALTYAPEPAYSLVLYINQSADEAGNAEMRRLTRAMIDLTLKHGGRFFLPYQLHYTGAELIASYPELPAFLAKKKELDPNELFQSTFYRAIKALRRRGQASELPVSVPTVNSRRHAPAFAPDASSAGKTIDAAAARRRVSPVRRCAGSARQHHDEREQHARTAWRALAR